ncbi:hypothetical protein KR009_011581, partial [Drosophila setifemur]
WRWKWKRSCSCCRKAKKRETRRGSETENELWLDYYALYLHLFPFKALCDRLETHTTKGLSSEVAQRKLERNGENVLPIPFWRVNFFVQLLVSLFTVLGVCMILSAIACGLMFYNAMLEGGPTDPEYLLAGSFLLLVTLTSGLLAMLQQNDTDAMVLAFDELMPTYCTVIRDNGKQVIATQEMVTGDIVPISYGQRIPADLRIFSSHGLVLDNVALTGKSHPVNIVPLTADAHQAKFARIAARKD